MVSLIGVFLDRFKAFAIAGLVIGIGTCALYLLSLLVMLASRA